MHGNGGGRESQTQVFPLKRRKSNQTTKIFEVWPNDKKRYKGEDLGIYIHIYIYS